MKQRKQFSWILFVLGMMLLETVFTVLCLILWKQRVSDYVRLAVSLLEQMILWWKYSFMAILLAAFYRTKKQPFHTAREGINSAFLLVLLLIIKVLYDTVLLVIPEIIYIGFSLEYLKICFGRMLFFMGVPGIAAIGLGMLFGRIPFRGAGYAFSGFVVVFTAVVIQNYNYYNINDYNPCPVYNPLVFEKDFSWSASETFGGSLYEEYAGLREDFSVTDYSLSVWISGEHLISGRSVMQLSDSTLSEYIFRLNSYMQVESVLDENNEALSWRQEGNYIIVSNEHGSIKEITMSYYCDNDYIIPVESHYVSLPSYLMWYPAAPDMESNYDVEVHFDYEVYCNLVKQEKNCFKGNAHTVSLLSGTLTGETYVGDARIIYPKLDFSEEVMRRLYLTQMVQIPKRTGMDLEGFDLFWDDRIASSFWQYYDITECLIDGYMFGGFV